METFSLKLTYLQLQRIGMWHAAYDAMASGLTPEAVSANEEIMGMIYDAQEALEDGDADDDE